MPTLGTVLSLIGAGLVSCLIVVLLKRRLYKEFPWFLLYLGSSVLITAIRLSFSGSYVVVFKVYWSTEAIYAVLALLVAHEVFRRMFLAFYLFRGFWAVFPTAVMLIIIILFKSVILIPPGAPVFIRIVLAVGVTAKYVEAGLFLIVLLLSLLLNVKWRSSAFGIIQGFAISALGTWLTYGLRSRFGIKVNVIATYGPPVAYICGVVWWLVVFSRNPLEGNTGAGRVSVQPEDMLEEIKHYTKFLWRVFRKP